ncbi:GLPGLI family protein [Ancylomarina sp. 16SWW S1-10-2]|uniref:GLPGLI family protein n=1 Tax=Ancylomarina sp. 16SWW S1-10-2 TaxID=2499681 RepID=UPI0012ADAA06|nr:GLPGLI family protein [Ancylomarina sp. 16SWW S1-10-2]MRT92802.1 GLPGLI family protein [Ancylomarina sp. 16SWW S1-10-2]
MKKTLFLIIGLLLSFTSHLWAQEFQGKAYYQSKTTVNIDLSGRNIPEDRKKMMMERMKKANEKTFILNFNQIESIYKEDVKLEQPGSNQGRGMGFGMMGSNGEDYYKNVKTGTYAVKNDLFGKIFLVQDSLLKLDWKMGAESKKIGKYTAFKATATRTIKRPNMAALFNRNAESKGEEYIEKEIQITAWYSPEIPINQGPANYWGLPGLILELSDDITSILCSEISMNPKEKVVIEAPSKGKKVNQAEYDEISKAKMLEMRENFKNNRGRRGGPGGRR